MIWYIDGRCCCCCSVEWGVLSVGDLQRDVPPQSSDSHNVSVLRSHASWPLCALRLLCRVFDGRVWSPGVTLLGQTTLSRTYPRPRALQGPSLPQGPCRLHGRQLPVRCRCVSTVEATEQKQSSKQANSKNNALWHSTLWGIKNCTFLFVQ